MRRLTRLALASAVLLNVAPVAPQAPPPEIAFDSAPSFLKLPPDLHLGEPSGVAVNSKGHIFVFNRGNTTGPAYAAAAAQLSLDGKVLGWLGKTGRQPKQFGWIHEMACPSENELYVAEILTWRVQKLTLHP